MKKSLQYHEKDSELMAIKLTSMKMQLMENETSYGLRRKFGAVKLTGDRIQSCTVSIFKVIAFLD